ncbi:MAG TPA: STAS domain-containing protein [bacterium]|nr:STAS domain-containing protein [bacterium]HPN31554.1 STAS domain-containing protein [bacterium]
MQIKKIGDTRIAVLPERLDSNVTAETEQGLNEILNSGCGSFICDFSKTSYISSAGLRVLIKAAKQIKSQGGRIVLFGLNEYVLEVLETAGFTNFFKIVKNQEEALDDVKFTFGWDASNI